MKRFLFALCLLWPLAAVAQQTPIVTSPQGVNASNDSGAITATGTFQSLWAASDNVRGRLGCVVINLSARTQYIYVGLRTNATTPKSIPLTTTAPGNTFHCADGVVVVKDGISISGIKDDTFYASQY